MEVWGTCIGLSLGVSEMLGFSKQKKQGIVQNIVENRRRSYIAPFGESGCDAD